MSMTYFNPSKDDQKSIIATRENSHCVRGLKRQPLVKTNFSQRFSWQEGMPTSMEISPDLKYNKGLETCCNICF